MKKCLVIGALAAVLCVSQIAAAGEDAKAETEKSPAEVKTGIVTVTATADDDAKTKTDAPGPNHGKLRFVTVTTKSSDDGKTESVTVTPVEVRAGTVCVGRVVTIGPDGKVDVKELGDRLPKEVLDKLPKEIRVRVMKESAAGGSCLGGATGKMKIVVRKNGETREFETDLSDPEAIKDLSLGKLQEALKKAGKKLSAEDEELLEAASENMKARIHVVTATKPADDISGKLDKILERLERLEEDVKTLKAEKKE